MIKCTDINCGELNSPHNTTCDFCGCLLDISTENITSPLDESIKNRTNEIRSLQKKLKNYEKILIEKEAIINNDNQKIKLMQQKTESYKDIISKKELTIKKISDKIINLNMSVNKKDAKIIFYEEKIKGIKNSIGVKNHEINELEDNSIKKDKEILNINNEMNLLVQQQSKNHNKLLKIIFIGSILSLIIISSLILFIFMKL